MGKQWANNGAFKIKKECLKNNAFFAIYFFEEDLSQDEINGWIKLKENIKKYLQEMKYIRCPICKRSTIIDLFEKSW